MSSIYIEHQKIDLARQKRDLLYHLILNTDASTLTDCCKQITEQIYTSYGEAKMSIRLKKMLHKIVDEPDRIAKHALLFFALYQEANTIDIFLGGETPRVPPDKFKRFVEVELPPLIEKLMKGAFTSLRAFVEDVRWAYITL